MSKRKVVDTDSHPSQELRSARGGMPTSDQDLARRILGLRRHTLGLTQARFAELVGVTQPEVSKWEKGFVKPNDSHLRRLAQLDGKPVAVFRYGGLGARGTGGADEEAAYLDPDDEAARSMSAAIWPEGGDTVVLQVKGRSMDVAGIVPGDLLIVDRGRAPLPGQTVVADQRASGDSGPRTLLRLFNPPHLVPRSTDSRFTVIGIGEDHRIAGTVMVLWRNL